MSEQKNLLLALALSLVVLVSFQLLFAPPPEPASDGGTEQPADAAQGAAGAPDGRAPTPSQGGDAATPPTLSGNGLEAQAPTLAGQPPAARAGLDRQAALERGRRIAIDTPRLRGSLTLTGGRIDDLTLKDYTTEVGGSETITLLHPAGSAQAYYATFGWTVREELGIDVPGPATEWESDDTVLSPGSPVELSWTNAQGMTFTRRIEVDRDFLFTVTQSVRNPGATPALMAPYGLISRRGTPPTEGFFILHEGPLGVFDGALEEESYENVREENFVADSVGGWLGITDKYWLTAIVPEQDRPFTGRFVSREARGTTLYQADYLEEEMVVPAGGAKSVTVRLFAGAKEVDVIERYESAYSITLFDRAVDWGWFIFLTKPIFYTLDWLYGLTANFGVAILILTVLVKLLFFPLANKSYVSMGKMKAVQPKMKKLQERYKDDKPRLQQELMALYKKEKINPMAGCLPILVQIPVFFALYKVLFVTIEMRHQPGFFWVNDLSAPDPLLIFNLFGLVPWDPPSFLAVGVWPVIMGVSMFFQQRLTMTTAMDPLQQRILMAMPFVFIFIMARFPAGLVIYWTWNTVLSALQQWMIMRRHGVPVTSSG